MYSNSAMPIFGSKFSPKKSRVRKSILTLNTDQVEELVLDNRKIKLQLGDQELHFENGQWIPGNVQCNLVGICR